MANNNEEPVTSEVMLTFYRRLYPFKSIFNWLNHEHTPTRLFTHREFAFTLAGDVYLRYNSFNTAEELKKQVCNLNPSRFEIGPVYSARPRDKKTVRPAAFSPQLRELVFDIDMTDYDSIRTCCSDAGICQKCWGFIAAAVHVLDKAIREQFGYERLLWVYSGRRGIHLWISDREAMELTDDQRKALVSWMTVIQGGKEMHKKVNVRQENRPLPPPLKSCIDILGTVFTNLILETQDCFESKEGWDALLALLPKSVSSHFDEEWWSVNSYLPSTEKWDKLRELRKRHFKADAAVDAAFQDIILQYTYPRLDAEVSKHRNHLLKAPFCIHPKTGRVCVPVDPATVDKFDPAKVPTVRQLLDELDDISPAVASENGEHHADWEQTKLKPYVEILDKHALAIMNDVRRNKRGGTDMTW